MTSFADSGVEAVTRPGANGDGCPVGDHRESGAVEVVAPGVRCAGRAAMLVVVGLAVAGLCCGSAVALEATPARWVSVEVGTDAREPAGESVGDLGRDASRSCGRQVGVIGVVVLAGERDCTDPVLHDGLGRARGGAGWSPRYGRAPPSLLV